MKVRLIAIILGMFSVAALAFQGGRLTGVSPKPPENGDASKVAAIEADQTERPPASVLTDVREIVDAPFDTLYRSLKAAPPELLNEWAKDLEKIAATPTRWAAITTFCKALIQVNPVAARKIILELKKENRWQAMLAIREAAPPRAMKEVAEVLLSYDRMEISSCGWDFLREAIDEWSRNDPIAVKHFIEEHPKGDMERYSGKLVRNWAASDPEAARDWVTQQLERRQIPQKTSEEGSYSEEDYGDYDREEILQGWVEGFLENDREAALSYLLAHDNDEIAKALPGVVGAVFLESPEEASAFILRLPENRQAEALGGVIDKADRFVWGDADDRTRSPEFVADWMLQFPSEMWRENIPRVLLEWKYRNTPEMLAWMGDLPNDTQRTVVTHYDFYLGSDSAEEEFQMVMDITNTALRDQLLERLMEQAKQHRAQILGWLEKAPLPAEQRTRLVSLIPPPEEEASDTSEEEEE
jgi:hypothetical protein